jgi:hypothetical protein
VSHFPGLFFCCVNTRSPERLCNLREAMTNVTFPSSLEISLNICTTREGAMWFASEDQRCRYNVGWLQGLRSVGVDAASLRERRCQW